jgi:TPR repeat protein
MYETGFSVPSSGKEAQRWFHLAADHEFKVIITRGFTGLNGQQKKHYSTEFNLPRWSRMDLELSAVTSVPSEIPKGAQRP